LADGSVHAPLKATDFGISVFFKEGDVFTELVGSAYYVSVTHTHTHTHTRTHTDTDTVRNPHV
jgi:hypothetical protein